MSVRERVDALEAELEPILLAAHEAAWEQPGTGHGLLTKALIDVLTDADKAVISLTSAVDLRKLVSERREAIQLPAIICACLAAVTLSTRPSCSVVGRYRSAKSWNNAERSSPDAAPLPPLLNDMYKPMPS